MTNHQLRKRTPGRPRAPLDEPKQTVTARIRHLIDIVHDGSVREASVLTEVPYPTLNDLYIGRTEHPSLVTLDKLRQPYGIDLAWFLAEKEVDEAPLQVLTVMLPPGPNADAKRRVLREVPIPFAAASMCTVFTRIERNLAGMAATPDRPIVGEAADDALRFRLATFLLQPLLAAEKSHGGLDLPTADEYSGLPPDRKAQWTNALQALGDVWTVALANLLSGREDYLFQEA